MKQYDRHPLKGAFLLLLATLIWGVSFVFQSKGNDLTGPLTFNLLRCLTASVTAFVLLKAAPDSGQNGRDRSAAAGICSGITTFLMTALLQLGMAYGTAVGKAGFLSATAVIMVPLIGILQGRREPWNTWTAVFMTAAGMYLLCFHGTLTLAFSDLLILLSALASALQILILDHFRDSFRAPRVAFLQFVTAAVLSLFSVLVFERPASFSEEIRLLIQPAVIIAVLYAGVLSSGVGYTLQIQSHKYLEPAVISVLMCFESVFAALAGWLLLHEVLTGRELAGCVLIFLAAVLSQLSFGRKRA